MPRTSSTRRWPSPTLNKGIALLNQQKLPEAEEALQQAAAKDPRNPRVWYNLGLVHRGEGKTDEAIADFQKVLKIDPTDPDAYYFLGTFYSQQQDYPKAIDAFQQALKINPLHASAEFGMGRALQRSGKTDEARVHLKRFEYLTHNKISSPITLTYGEQGRYSVAQDVITNEPAVGPMIPVTFVPQALGARGKDGATAGRNLHARCGWRWEVRHRFDGGGRFCRQGVSQPRRRQVQGRAGGPVRAGAQGKGCVVRRRRLRQRRQE